MDDTENNKPDNVVSLQDRMFNIPDEMRYVMFCINTDGTGAFVEYHKDPNRYEALGMLAVAKEIMMEELHYDDD